MPRSLELKTRYRRSESVAHRQIADEVLLVPIRTDPGQNLKIYTLNKTAAAIWDWLDGERDLSQLLVLLCGRFQVEEGTALRDLEDCCLDLEAFGAIERVGDRP
jgi:hypothetical protein